MKKSLIYILSICFLLFQFSCSEELDISPQENDVVQPDFADLGDLESTLFGVYSGFKSANYYLGSVVALGSWTGDNLKLADENTGQGAIQHEWDYTEGDSQLEGAWVSIYRVVRRANFIIKNADAVEGDADDKETAQQYKGEALVVRALAHLDAHRLYGQKYETGAELSVPFITDPDDILQEQPRISINELFGLLKNDLNEALGLLNDEFAPNRASKALAYGLLARIASFERSWSEVVQHASSAISNGPALAKISDYDQMFGENDEAGETIFKITADPDDTKLGDPFYTDGVGPRFDPTNDLVALYDELDVRFEANFVDLDGRLIIGKYYGAPSNRGLHDAIVMRVSEMVLLKAEAFAEQSNDLEARNELDLIRSNRIIGYTTVGEAGQALKDAIKLERRKEFAYEGIRFFDLKRWNEDVVRNDCTANECLLSASDFRFVFAIPRAELFANSNMEQNPGY
jgi:hypothetical protein